MFSVFIALCGLSQPLGKPIMLFPDIHGDQVVFSCEGDIWLGDLKTGRSERLTSDAGQEDNPVFSPDGTMIAFHGEYDGIRGVYVMPTEGGSPRRLTFAMEFRSVTGWTPDGKSVVFRKVGTPTNYEYWTAPVGDGVYHRMPLEFASHLWFGPDSDTYCFTRFNRWLMSWFHYDGGMQNQIWVHKDGKFSQLTQVPGTNEYPVWCGGKIYFVNEQNAKFTLMSVSPNGGKVSTEAGPFDVEVRELSTDGKRIVFEQGPSSFVFDPATRKATEFELNLASDLIHMRPFQVTAQSFATDASISPTGKRVFSSSRGQIVSLPVGDGEARVWKTEPGARLQMASMSPDAKKVAYVSDKSGEQQIYVANADGSGEKVVTGGQRQIKRTMWSPDSKWIAYYDSRMMLRVVNVETGQDDLVGQYSGTWYGGGHDFSPDSKWLVYSANEPHTTINTLHLYNVADKRNIRVSDGSSDDTAPAFSRDGKWITFVSVRNLSPNGDPVLNQLNLDPTDMVYMIPLADDTKSPFELKDPAEETPEKPKEESKDTTTKIDLEGLYDRRIEVPISPSRYRQTEMTNNRILVASADKIDYYDIVSKKGGTVTSGSGFELSRDGSKLLIGSGGSLRVVDSNASDLPPSAGAVSFGQLKLEIQPAKEWNQIFWDAWRLLRDYFYVQNMHGNDWKAIGDKYAAMLPRVRSRLELDELIRWMQSEIGSSHEYLGLGDNRDIKPHVAPGYLGIDLESAGSHLKIAHIVKGDGFRPFERSPLADPSLKVKEGMYLLKVGGAPVSSSVEFYDMLLGRAGQVVSVTVNDKPTDVGSKTVYVKPVGNENRMRYLDWVAKNREYVTKASGGRVGYLHMQAMGDGDMADFVKQYFPQRNKEALIVDDRFNNGGYIQTFVNGILSEKVSGYFNMRNSPEPWSRQSDAFVGPKCCLINEFAISCGEEFPHRFKDLNIGPLIGRRTMGGEVGSSPGWPLIDGAQIFVPNYGMFTPDGKWAIEGDGVSPDIDVPSDPNAWVAGRDPQLDVAVNTMLESLKKKPRVWPTEPPNRVRVKK